MAEIVLVTGATGQQGGAAARQLLADGWDVRAFVRDPDHPRARALAEAGAALVRGDMLDLDALTRAAEGAYGVFSVQPASTAPDYAVPEVRMGVNVADAAVAAGVRHLVYTSVGGADRDTGISHWNTKWQIEEHIRGLDLPTTVLRPVMFMENHATPRMGVFGEVALIRMVPATAKVQLIAVRDIGVFAALAFGDPDRYVGQVLEIAGDEVPKAELVAAFSAALGEPLNTEPLPAEALAAVGIDLDDLSAAESFAGWRADIPALRELHPGLWDLRTWLEHEGAALLKAHRG